MITQWCADVSAAQRQRTEVCRLSNTRSQVDVIRGAGARAGTPWAAPLPVLIKAGLCCWPTPAVLGDAGETENRRQRGR